MCVSHAEQPRSLDAVRRKINGQRLSQDDFRHIIHDVTESHYTKMEIAAFIVIMVVLIFMPNGLFGTYGQQVFNPKARKGRTRKYDIRPGFFDKDRSALEIFCNAKLKTRVA